MPENEKKILESLKARDENALLVLLGCSNFVDVYEQLQTILYQSLFDPADEYQSDKSYPDGFEYSEEIRHEVVRALVDSSVDEATKIELLSRTGIDGYGISDGPRMRARAIGAIEEMAKKGFETALEALKEIYTGASKNTLRIISGWPCKIYWDMEPTAQALVRLGHGDLIEDVVKGVDLSSWYPKSKPMGYKAFFKKLLEEAGSRELKCGEAIIGVSDNSLSVSFMVSDRRASPEYPGYSRSASITFLDNRVLGSYHFVQDRETHTDVYEIDRKEELNKIYLIGNALRGASSATGGNVTLAVDQRLLGRLPNEISRYFSLTSEAARIPLDSLVGE